MNAEPAEPDDAEEGEWLDGLRAAGLPVRADTARPLGPTVTRLAAHAATLVAASWAPATRTAYETSWARFDGWCRATGRGDPLDVDAAGVADYVAYHAATGLSPAYLERNLAAITAVFEMADRQSPARHPVVRRAVAGFRRLHGDGQRQAAPLSLDDLRRLVTGIAIVTGRPAHDPMIRRDRALLLTGWFGALRSSELVGLDVDDVTFTGDPDRGTGGGMLLALRAPKSRDGITQHVAVPYNTHYATCPVRALMAVARQQRTGPLFRRIDRHGRTLGRLRATAVSVILRRHVVDVLASNPEPFSSHSLRAGWTTEARAAQLPDIDIARHLRHTSTRQLATYYRPTDLYATATTRAMGEW